MSSFEELVKQQKDVGGRIESIIRNFKKDPAVRKQTASYFQERLRRLDEEWSAFETVDTQIRLSSKLPLDHEYFTNDYYNAIMTLVEQYKDVFESSMLQVPQQSVAAVAEDVLLPKVPQQHVAAGSVECIELVKLMRRQAAIMSSLERLLGDSCFNDQDASIALRLWQNIEDLHYQMAEKCDDIEKEGYNMNRFVSLEADLRRKTRSKPNESNSSEHIHRHQDSIPMPKITLPRFDGNFLKWQEFYDLFSSLIICQQMPKVQKMWYLKTHLIGEPATLIKHFAATEENFDAAWAMVVDRYNNKRLLVNTLVKELVDSPYRATNDNYKGLHDKTQECLLSLQNLKIDTSAWDPLLLHLLLKRLDQSTRLRYEQSLLKPREVPTIKEFLEFLERHFQSMESMSVKSADPRTKTCTSAAAEIQNNGSCVMCKNGKHPLFACKAFLQIAPTARLQFIQKNKYCVNCLKPGHNSKACSAKNCTKCNKKHNTLLHLELQNKNTMVDSHRERFGETSSELHRAASGSQEAATLTASKQSRSNAYIILSTAIVNIKANGKEVQCRALLDSGSQLNFVSERLIKRLGIHPKATSILINGIGSNSTRIQERVNVALHSQNSNFTTRLEAAVLPHIISPQPSQPINIENWLIPKNIALADPCFNRPDKIDVLLGAEFYHQLLAIGQIKLANNLPTLQNTVLGWVIAGKVGGHQSITASCGVCTDNDIFLEDAIAQLWQLDNISTSDKNLSISERQCEDHFTQNHSIGEDGKFMVKIPFCESPAALGESHSIAFNRFLALERRLSKHPEIKNQYIQFMNEYEALGHMTKIDIGKIAKPYYVIPHHCVLRPESLTTKLRVVFDASAKTSSEKSLNDMMHTGPTVQSELFSILLRFRQPRFVFTTDVEKMYRQILMHPEDRKFQIIIWRTDPSKPITYYQLNTVTYGTRAAPFLATKCLEKMAHEQMLQNPYGAKFLLENFYVDDGIGGDDSLTTTLAIQRQLIDILNQHGLRLQKWSANHPQLLQNVKSMEQEVDIDFKNNEAVKTLGLKWIPTSDQLCVKVCLGDINRVTKRTVTSDLAKLFDPLGLLAPVTISAKIFIQELWQLKLEWDQALPSELHTKWITFRNELEHLNNLKFSRHVFEGHIASKVQIHAFADASEKAYGAAIYIRSEIKDRQVLVRLLCAKTRVAPLKRQTLPRLELCAAVLSAQLTTKVRKDLKLENVPTYFWTDSEIVLAWINSESSSYQTFVANRISAIQEISSAEQWRHVKSKDNPADVISRGLAPSKLSSCVLWRYGPIFLHGREGIWPQVFTKEHNTVKNDIHMERKKISAIATAVDISHSEIYNIQHHGSFRTLQRIVGYMLRFVNNSRKQNRGSELALTVQELDQALLLIIRAIQQTDFEEDLKHLKKYEVVSKNSPYKNLTPFLDTNGIIRVGGRLDASNVPYDAKHPMLIPYNDPISKLLLQMIHEQNRHCGPQALLAHARQRYWPVKGKTAARSIVQHCVRCARAKPRLLNQIMGNLPSTRVTPARPFINSGVDFCGPFWIHYKIRGKKPQKAYIAVFCCLATKAVHLELVSDLTTEAFIGAIKRFISRRGHCQNLYCDNATNFVGANNQLKELSDAIYANSAHEKITNACTSRGITFHFIPPRAPHFGGIWEAAVKSAKHLLLRSVTTASLTYEELDTVVIEVEGILNSRPISPISNNPNDLSALTPGHFLIGEPLNAEVDSRAIPNRLSLLTRWKLVTHLKREFWRRWSREYLCELQYRNKWKTQQVNIRPGDMVIVKEDNTTPLEWPLGRVVKTYPGDDGIVRVADIKTSSGIWRRPIARLAPLPISNEKLNDIHQSCDVIETNNEELATPGNFNETNLTQTEIEMPNKRRRTSINNYIISIIVTLILLPLASGGVQNKQFDTLGLHFEGVGSTVISPTEWQLLVYYDLEGFWSESTTFSKGTETLGFLCEKMQQKAACTNLVKYFQHTKDEITIENTLISGTRHKRAALNIVGNIANSLFGVLDSEYADQMSKTISQVKENEVHLLNLLKNQTSIVDSTINIMKSDQAAVKKKFDGIDYEIAQIYNRIHNESNELQEEKIYRVFSSLCIQLTIAAANLQRTQSSILDILTNTHHGLISPLLLTPHQLQQEVEKLKVHLPESLELPVAQEDIFQLYKLMKVKGGLTKTTLIFSVTLPLVEHDQFDIFNLVPVPRWINNTLISVNPCSTLLALNTVNSQYFTISNDEFNSCKLIKVDTYLCYKGQIRYEHGSKTCSCELNLFYNNTQADCPLQLLKNNIAWIPLRHQNKWIYTMPFPSQATAVCKKEITQLTLKGSGLLTLEPECVLKHNFMSVQGQQIVSSSLKASYTSSLQITKRLQSEHLTPMLTQIHRNEYISQIKNLTALQTSLAEQEIFQLPNKLSAHNYHHTIVGYVALSLIALILIILKFKRTQQNFVPTASIPTPAPRSSEFTVHV